MNYNFKILIIFTIIFLTSCQNKHEKPVEEEDKIFQMDQSKNLLSNAFIEDFQWMNKPQDYDMVDNTISIKAMKGTDYFNNPEDGSITATAPFYYQQVEGDFVATALVEPDFGAMWNACALMVHIDSSHWIKFAFENSDATGKSIVTVVTREVSDDANGVLLSDHKKVWLKMVRKGDNYAMHWSIDGEGYKMARLSSLPSPPIVKVGLEAQSPVGDLANHQWLYFNIEKKTVKDLRKGE